MPSLGNLRKMKRLIYIEVNPFLTREVLTIVIKYIADGKSWRSTQVAAVHYKSNCRYDNQHTGKSGKPAARRDRTQGVLFGLYTVKGSEKCK